MKNNMIKYFKGVKIFMENNYAKAIIALNKILTSLVFVFYPCMLLYLMFTNPVSSWPSLSAFAFVPGISFVLVSIFRRIWNAPRPYEVNPDLNPILKKDSKGKSFPSRHIFSIFIISITVYKLWPVIGILIGIAGIVLAYCRVKGGIHFLKDVIAGAIIGILLGIIGFAIWPL